MRIMLGSTGISMQTRSFPATPDGRSPAGAEIRYLIEGETGNMIHSTVPPGQVNRATVHATVSEFWHVLSGEGRLHRHSGWDGIPVSLHRRRATPVPLHQHAALARRQGSDGHRGPVETDCSRRLTTAQPGVDRPPARNVTRASANVRECHAIRGPTR